MAQVRSFNDRAIELPHLREKKAGYFLLVESRIQLKEYGSVPATGIQNPLAGIRNPWCGIQNPRLSWIPLHGATN